MNQIFGKGLSYLKNGGIGVSYCWNYGPSKLLLHFIEKTILCENTNTFFSKNHWKLGKMNVRFWKNILDKGKVTFDSFRNFVCVSNYVHVKSFAWKRGCPISSKLQTSRIWPRQFRKALTELYKLHPNRKH